jgi:hypothetical protein
MMDEARPGQTRSCSRSTRSGIRLVHREFDTLDLKAAKALLDELRARISERFRFSGRRFGEPAGEY